MPNILGDLTYSKFIPTHVEPDFNVIEGTLQNLEDKYYTNRDTADKFEIMMSNLNILPQDQYIKDEAINGVKSTVQRISERGDWENAGLVVRDMAKNFATDQGIKLAMNSYAKKQEDDKLLDERVKAGEITQQDAIDEKTRAAQSYTGIAMDENGVWKGSYATYQPPKWEDRGEYLNKFAKDWPTDKIFQGLVKGEDGNFYLADTYQLTTTPDGSTYIAQGSERATLAEVQQAFRAHLMQNQPIMERMSYELSKDKTTTKQYHDAGMTANAMRTTLDALGFSKKDYDKLNDEQLTEMYRQEMKIWESTESNVLKTAHEKQSVEVIGATEASQIRLKKVKTATDNGGDVDTPQHYAIIEAGLTPWTVNPDAVFSLDDYNKTMGSIKLEKASHESTIQTNKQEMLVLEKERNLLVSGKQDTKFVDAKIKAEQAKIDRAETEINNLSRLEKVQQNHYNRAYDKVKQDLILTKGEAYVNKAEQQFKEVEAYRKEAIQPIKNIINKLPEFKEGKVVSLIGEETTTAEYIDDVVNNYADAKHLLTKLDLYSSNYSNITKEDKQALQEHVDRLERVSEYDTHIRNNIEKELKRYAEATSTQHPFIDLTTDAFGNQTDFSKTETAKLRERFSEYKLIRGTDGEELSLQLKDNKDIIDPAAAKVIGVTGTHVGSLGNLLVVNEYDVLTDDKGKKTITDTVKRTVLIKPPSGGAFEQNAIRELSKDVTWQKGKLVKQGFNPENNEELKALLMYDQVAGQLATFQSYPPLAPQDLGSKDAYAVTEVPLALGNTYDGNAVRRVDKAGNQEYTVTLTDTKTKKSITKDYEDFYQMQLELEGLAGLGFKVPSSALVAIDSDAITYGKPKSADVVARVAPEFLEELVKVDEAIGEDWTITDALRNQEMNENVHGVSNSPHLYGLGIDGRYKATHEANLRTKSEPLSDADGAATGWYKLNNANIMWMVHEDEKHDKHLHFQMFNEPAGIRERHDVLNSFQQIE